MSSPTYSEIEREKAWNYAKERGWAMDDNKPYMVSSQSPMMRVGPADLLLQYPSTFESILNNAIPASGIYSDDQVAAIFDLHPVAPIHIVIFPKDRTSGLTQISNVQQHHTNILGHMIYVASMIAKQFNLINGYRLVINDGNLGGQTEPHVCVHLLGNRQMQWPPG